MCTLILRISTCTVRTECRSSRVEGVRGPDRHGVREEMGFSRREREGSGSSRRAKLALTTTDPELDMYAISSSVVVDAVFDCSLCLFLLFLRASQRKATRPTSNRMQDARCDTVRLLLSQTRVSSKHSRSIECTNVCKFTLLHGRACQMSSQPHRSGS